MKMSILSTARTVLIALVALSGVVLAVAPAAAAAPVEVAKTAPAGTGADGGRYSPDSLKMQF